ncbi:hypothetical protein SDC9_104573 [bioreactor metagenome]|uniref:Uncharacterized protein n=1 Tax=bioreactor metagenome TaxID=1076179 RepID=A0A645AX59_9ZZZZ
MSTGQAAYDMPPVLRLDAVARDEVVRELFQRARAEPAAAAVGLLTAPVD